MTKESRRRRRAAPEAESSAAPNVDLPVERSLFPAWAGARWRVAMLVAAVVAVVAAFSAPPLVRRAIRARQRALPENSAWRAIEALDAGDDAAARRELARWMADLPVRREKGIDVLRFGLVPEPAFAENDLELARRLARRGWTREARELGWRALRRIHVFSRGTEDPEPWLLLASLCGDDGARRDGILRVAAAHGLATLRRAVGAAAGGSPEIGEQWLAAARDVLQARALLSPGEEPPPRRVDVTGPTIRGWRDRNLVEAALARRDATTAKRLAAEFGKSGAPRFDRESISARALGGETADRFLDRLAAQRSVDRVDTADARAVASSFCDRREIRRDPDGALRLPWSVVVEIPFRSSKAGSAILLALSGSDVLGIPPILLVSLDGGEPFAVTVDSAAPVLESIPVAASAGEHRLVIEYLNDFQTSIGGRLLDRNVVVSRVAIGFDEAPAAREPGARPPNGG